MHSDECTWPVYGCNALRAATAAVNSILHYSLMLLAMTFDVYIFFSIMVGFALGTLIAGHWNDEPGMAKYEAHNAEVRRRVPRSQLLVYSVDQGWAPLCKFLDLPIPDQPFPNLNDQHMFRRFCRVLLGASVVLPCLATIIVAWALSRVARHLAAR